MSENIMIEDVRAGFWVRVLATLIDCFIIGFISKILSFVLIGRINNEFCNYYNSMDIISYFVSMIKVFIIYGLVSMFYETILVGYNGQTVGKMLAHIKIVNMDGTNVSYTKSFSRFLSKCISQMTSGIGFLLVAFRSDKRGLHDLIVDTKVVKIVFRHSGLGENINANI